MRNIRPVWILISALLVFGCGEKSPAPGVTVEMIDGIECVHNPAAPLHPEKSVRFEEELCLGGEDEAGEPLFSQLWDFVVDADGRIYIADTGDAVIRAFGPDGRPLFRFGGKGEGPGEFRSPSYLGFRPDGNLLVLDFRSRRTSLFDPSGGFLKGINMSDSLLNHLHCIMNDSYLTSEYVTDDTGDKPFARRRYINRYDFEGNKLNSLGEFKNPETRTIRIGNSMGGITVPFSTQSVFAADHQRKLLYHCLTEAYRIEVFDPAGGIVRRFDRPYTRLPLTAEDIREIRARGERSRSPMSRKIWREVVLPDLKPVTNQMWVDDRGFLWVKTFEEREEEGRTLRAFDVFDMEGRFDARVWSDLTPRLFRDGKMYVRHTDEETGYQFVKRFDVTWTGDT